MTSLTKIETPDQLQASFKSFSEGPPNHFGMKSEQTAGPIFAPKKPAKIGPTALAPPVAPQSCFRYNFMLNVTEVLLCGGIPFADFAASDVAMKRVL